MVAYGAAFALAPVSASAEAVRVLALGDSLTAGFGLPEAQGFVPRLQAWLDAAGVEAVVENAGVSGDTTAGGRARLDWALASAPQAAIVALGGNDLLRGIDPASSRANLDAILTRLRADGIEVLLVGLEAPSNFGPGFKAAFDAMYPELAAAHGTLHEASFLAPLIAELPLQAARARYMQADGIHPNAEGVEVIVAALGPRVAELVARVE